jgi:hypothetical protein
MTTKFTYWQEEDGKFLGYLNDYPDHWSEVVPLAEPGAGGLYMW